MLGNASLQRREAVRPSVPRTHAHRYPLFHLGIAIGIAVAIGKPNTKPTEVSVGEARKPKSIGYAGRFLPPRTLLASRSGLRPDRAAGTAGTRLNASVLGRVPFPLRAPLASRSGLRLSLLCSAIGYWGSRSELN